MRQLHQVIEYLLNNTDAALVDIPDNELFYKNKTNGYGVHLLPFIFPGEGHYIALIKKPGELIRKVDKNYYQKKEKFGDYLFILSEDFSIKHLNVIRYGVKIGQVDKKDIRYDYHYARFVKDFNQVLDIDTKALLQYYQGETINKPVNKGYILLKYQGINVDIAKSDGRIIKNRLPKGLRKKLIA